MIGEHVTFFDALREWIADIMTGATTDWVVIEDLAMSVQAAQTRTRIVTLLIDAGQMRRTFRADKTLGTTVWRRALVTRAAGAHRAVVHHAADTVRTAW